MRDVDDDEHIFNADGICTRCRKTRGDVVITGALCLPDRADVPKPAECGGPGGPVSTIGMPQEPARKLTVNYTPENAAKLEDAKRKCERIDVPATFTDQDTGKKYPGMTSYVPDGRHPVITAGDFRGQVPAGTPLGIDPVTGDVIPFGEHRRRIVRQIMLRPQPNTTAELMRNLEAIDAGIPIREVTDEQWQQTVAGVVSGTSEAALGVCCTPQLCGTCGEGCSGRKAADEPTAPTRNLWYETMDGPGSEPVKSSRIVIDFSGLHLPCSEPSFREFVDRMRVDILAFIYSRYLQTQKCATPDSGRPTLFDALPEYNAARKSAEAFRKWLGYPEPTPDPTPDPNG